ncbi:unnamed protein product [Periconia digitata]|uniref:Uncharacterized protein n=1 Tax=Periconia digitata TaxID=1303443 RepID=A0A9W4UEI0_9PLEO|nr:unnamed protein product [Periconia digitata]
MCLLHLQHLLRSRSTTKHPVGRELLALGKLTSQQPHGFLLHPLHRRTQVHKRYHAPLPFNPTFSNIQLLTARSHPYGGGSF